MLITLIILLIMANMAHTYTPGTAPSALSISTVSLMRREPVILMSPVRKVKVIAFAQGHSQDLCLGI